MTTNQFQGSKTLLSRMIAKLMGRETPVGSQSRRRSRPAVEGLENREVMSVSPAVNAVCAIEAVTAAPAMLSGIQKLATQYGPVWAAAMGEIALSNNTLTSFLKAQGLGSVAATPGATTLLADDVIFDMTYASANTSLSASTLRTNELLLDVAYGYGMSTPTNATTTGSSNLSQTLSTLGGLTRTDTLASFGWNGNAQLQATADATISPVGFNQLAANAGFPNLKIFGVNSANQVTGLYF